MVPHNVTSLGQGLGRLSTRQATSSHTVMHIVFVYEPIAVLSPFLTNLASRDAFLEVIWMIDHLTVTSGLHIVSHTNYIIFTMSTCHHPHTCKTYILFCTLVTCSLIEDVETSLCERMLSVTTSLALQCYWGLWVINRTESNMPLDIFNKASSGAKGNAQTAPTHHQSMGTT